MVRPRYPSDDRSRPHVRIHLSCRSHPRYGAVFDRLEDRAIVWGLWLLAVQYHAARTNDEVTLGAGDLAWLTGRTQYAHGVRALRAVCERMGYAVRDQGRRVVVKVRNLQRKQGLAPTDSAPTPPEKSGDSAPPKSDDRSPMSDSSPIPTPERIQTSPENTVPPAAPALTLTGSPEPVNGKSKTNGRRRRLPKTLMPTEFTPEQTSRLARLVARHNLDAAGIKFCCHRVYAWSHGHDKVAADWVLTVANAIHDGWARKGLDK